MDQRALHIQDRLEDGVVDVDNEVQVASVLAVRFAHLEDLGRRLRNVQSQQQKVLGLAQQTHERGVKVDVGKARRRVLAQQGLLQLLLGRGVNLLCPLLAVLLLELLEALQDGRVRAQALLAFLAVHDLRAHALEAIHGLLHALHQRAHPRHGSRARRGVVVDGRQVHAQHENLLHLLEVCGILVEEVRILLLEVRLHDVALENALERVEQLEAQQDRDAVIEGLRNDRCQAPLQLLDLALKVVEVGVKLLRLHVHVVVLGLLEDLDCLPRPPSQRHNTTSHHAIPALLDAPPPSLLHAPKP